MGLDTCECGETYHQTGGVDNRLEIYDHNDKSKRENIRNQNKITSNVQPEYTHMAVDVVEKKK